MNKHETIADIIAEMRDFADKQEKRNLYDCRHLGTDALRGWADIFDAAHKRDIEDAERRGNHAAIKATCETIEKVGPLYDAESVGNAAKLREALKLCCSQMCKFCKEKELARSMLNKSVFGVYCHPTECKAFCAVSAALSAPTRNCDRPECATTKAAQDVWRKEDGGKTAYYEWLLATYKEGGNDGR